MPATFPAHQGAVLPLKLWRPQWFDGVALGVGAASPDVAYLLDGSNLPVWPFSHEWLGLLGWCLPVTVLVTWLLRRAAPVVAAHLPVAGPLALRDYGALRTGGHRWWVTAWSAVLGGASHIVLDLVGDPNETVEYVLHVVGGLVTLAVMVVIGRGRLLLAWHGPAPEVVRRPALFWSVAAAVTVTGFTLVPFLPAAFLQHTTGARLVAVVTVALLAGAVVARGRKGAVWVP